MSLDVAARLAVLLACAVAAGALFVRQARPRPANRRAPDPGASHPIPGAIDAALGGFILVAGGSALASAGSTTGGGAGLVVVQLAGIGLLAADGLLSIARLRLGRPRQVGAAALVSIAWLGAGLALAAPLVILLAAAVVLAASVRVAPSRR
jgi:hypothetical protein